jgi:hypothetical protein
MVHVGREVTLMCGGVWEAFLQMRFFGAQGLLSPGPDWVSFGDDAGCRQEWQTPEKKSQCSDVCRPCQDGCCAKHTERTRVKL